MSVEILEVLSEIMAMLNGRKRIVYDDGEQSNKKRSKLDDSIMAPGGHSA